jgi:hypothetical protein
MFVDVQEQEERKQARHQSATLGYLRKFKGSQIHTFRVIQPEVQAPT